MGKNKNKDEYAQYLKKRIREYEKPKVSDLIDLQRSSAKAGAYRDALGAYQKFIADGTLAE